MKPLVIPPSGMTMLAAWEALRRYKPHRDGFNPPFNHSEPPREGGFTQCRQGPQAGNRAVNTAPAPKPGDPGPGLPPPAPPRGVGQGRHLSDGSTLGCREVNKCHGSTFSEEPWTPKCSQCDWDVSSEDAGPLAHIFWNILDGPAPLITAM